MRLNSIITAMLLALFAVGGLGKASEAAEKGKPPSVSVTKAKGGYTVEELYSNKDKLNGKQVSVRGKVVKFNSGIMGKNWVHVQDGTGKQGTNDVTATTNQNTKVGDIVLITGKLVTNKDFGAGYKYDVIIEEATVKIEK